MKNRHKYELLLRVKYRFGVMMAMEFGASQSFSQGIDSEAPRCEISYFRQTHCFGKCI